MNHTKYLHSETDHFNIVHFLQQQFHFGKDKILDTISAFRNNSVSNELERFSTNET